MSIRPAPPDAALAVLDFWFGPLDASGMPAPERMRRWFDADEALDEAIRVRFAADLERARTLDEWRRTTRGTLALVILLDQFSRNIHRGSPEAFARDDLALALAVEAIDTGADRALHPIERVFLYMPLEHAEDPVVQERSVACFRVLAGEVPPSLREQFRSFASFAEAHRDVVARFGRFPHRNAVLGRTSTPEERAYLADGAPSWGQRATGDPDSRDANADTR